MSKYTVQAFPEACIAGFNEQINAEMQAFYHYRALSYHFSRHDVALKNVAAMFNAMSLEEVEHANILSRYLQSRGGVLTYAQLQVPNIAANLTLEQALALALDMEKNIHNKLRALQAIADKANESQCASFLDDVFLTEQVEAEDALMRMLSVVRRMGTGLGEELFDQSLDQYWKKSE